MRWGQGVGLWGLRVGVKGVVVKGWGRDGEGQGVGVVRFKGWGSRGGDLG